MRVELQGRGYRDILDDPLQVGVEDTNGVSPAGGIF